MLTGGMTLPNMYGVEHIDRIRNRVPPASEHSGTQRYHSSALPTTAMQLQARRTPQRAHCQPGGAENKVLTEKKKQER